MKTRDTLRNVEEQLRIYLGLKHHLIAVKLVTDGNEVEGALQPEAPMAFCHIVRRVSIRGDSFMYSLDHEKCPTAQGVLGFRGLRRIRSGHIVVPPLTKGVLVSPLGKFHCVPDVVLTILTPRQMMDLTILLQEGTNAPLLAEFTGAQACAEFFAKPYIEGKPNVSLLCKGAREIYSDFRDDEIVFGAPFGFYVKAAETIERFARKGGALCGCQTSDIPTEIVNQFEKIGFSKGIDYFFGKVFSHNIRVYLGKDLDGRLKFLTISLHLRMPSEEDAEKLVEIMKQSLPQIYSIGKRSYWLDLSTTADEDALGIDLFDGLSVKAAIERFVARVTKYLDEMERVNQHGED